MIECRKAHKACSGGRPCERCSKLGLDDKCISTVRKKRILTKRYWANFMNNSNNGALAAEQVVQQQQQLQQQLQLNQLNRSNQLSQQQQQQQQLDGTNYQNGTQANADHISPRFYLNVTQPRSQQYVQQTQQQYEQPQQQQQQYPQQQQISPRLYTTPPSLVQQQPAQQQQQHTTNTSSTWKPQTLSVPPLVIDNQQNNQLSPDIAPKRPSFSLENYKIDNTMYTAASNSSTPRSLHSVSPDTPRSLPLSISPRGHPNNNVPSPRGPHISIQMSPRSLELVNDFQITPRSSVAAPAMSPRGTTSQQAMHPTSPSSTLPSMGRIDAEIAELRDLTRNLNLHSPRNQHPPSSGTPTTNNRHSNSYPPLSANSPRGIPTSGSMAATMGNSPRTMINSLPLHQVVSHQQQQLSPQAMSHEKQQQQQQYYYMQQQSQ
jgi:hypothetical protein